MNGLEGCRSRDDPVLRNADAALYRGFVRASMRYASRDMKALVTALSAFHLGDDRRCGLELDAFEEAWGEKYATRYGYGAIPSRM